MTKQIILIFAVLCSVQVQANSRYTERDTVQHEFFHDATELFQPLQPVYLDGVVVPRTGSGNWFVSVTGGVTAFLGTPLGCEDLFGRVKPSYNLAVGKWFTPAVLWNLLGYRYSGQEQTRWGLAPFVGVGLIHNSSNKTSPFAFSYGIQGQYRISKRVSAVLEFSGTTTSQKFDGYGRTNRLGDHMVSLTAGFTFHLGKIGWKRAADVTHYIHRNEQLIDYSRALSEKNSRYAGQHDRDKRTLAELKKILEIEGLLDTYGHLLEDEKNGQQGYPVNNYSGLNSLRARLKHRHWDGISPLDTAFIHNNNNNKDKQNPDSLVSNKFITAEGHNPMVVNHVSDSCIGAPVYFFFTLNTARLTDVSQKLNLDELARVAKKYDLHVRVTGAADSSTGTSGINDSLSQSRADFIVSELKKRGIPAERITKISRGGIADYLPTEANRHTKVELF